MASPQEIREKINYQPKKANFFDAPVTKKVVTSTFNTLKSPAKIRELIAKSAGVVGDTTKSLVGQYGDFNARQQQAFKDRNNMPKWMENTIAPFVSGVDTAKFIARETGAGVLSIGKTVDRYTRDQVYKNTQTPNEFSKSAEKKIFGREVGSVEDVYIKPAVKYAESKQSGGLEKFGLGILGGIVGMTVESPVGLPAKQPFKKLEKALLKELAESSDPLIIRDRLIDYPEFRADSKFTDATVNLITKKKTPKEVREVIESARRIVELNDAKKAGVSEAPQVLITKNAEGKDVVFKVRPKDLETVRQAIKNTPITGKQPLLTTKPVNDLLSRGYVDGGTIGRAQVDSLTKKVDDLTGSIEDLTKPALRTPAEVRKAVAQGRTSDGKFTFKPNREAESARAGRAGAKTPSNLVARVSDLAENSLKNKADGGREKSIKYLRDNPDEVVSGEVRLREIEDGRIVIEDGRHRLQVASETGVTPKFLDVTAEYTGKPSARVADLISSKTESIVSGKEVSDLLKQQGSRGGVSDWLRGTVAKENYTKQRISIKELLAKDPDLKDYIEKSGGKLRPYNSTAKIPPIVTSKGEVWDGYNRIAQAIKNGDTDIEVLRGTSPKGVNPNAYALAGAPAGFEEDGEGNLSFNPEMAMLGILGVGMIGKVVDPKTIVSSLKKHPRFDEIFSQIEAEFSIADTGLSKTTDNNYLRWSSFPKWIPSNLRDSKLMPKVLAHIENDTYPKSNATREQELYDTIRGEIEARMGVMPDAYTPITQDDAEMITEELLKAWDEDAQAMLNETVDNIHQTVSHVDIEGVHEVAKVLDTVPPIPKTPAKALKARKEQPNLNTFELPEQTRLQYIRQQIQDKFERLETTQKQITKAGNKINEDADAMLQQELYVGRTAERIDTVRQSVIRDENGKGTGLLERMRKDGIKIEDLGRYLHAKHAGERNAKVATINKALPDGGSGLTNAEAQAILKEFEGNETIAKYADEFREKVIKERIRILREEDLMTEDALAKIETAYANYVPLKVDMGDVQFGTRGKGFSAQGKDIKRVKGSDKTRYNPVIQAITDLEDTIIKAEKNKVGKSFLKLVRQNPNEKLWEAEALKYIPQYDKNGEVVMLDPKYKFADNVMEVREGGKVTLITVKDKQLAQAMKNLGTEKAVSKVLMAFNSYLRGVVTFYNPEFMLTNVQRDIQTALINVGGEKSTKLAGLIAKDIAPAMRGIYRETRGKKPAVKSSTDWQAVYKEMKEEGGRVGWFDLNEVGDRTHETIKLIERYNSDKTVDSFRRGIDSVGKYVSDMNESVEMAVRVATYKHLVESGMSKAESAKYAKNLTVNFNKKGNLGVALNSLYLFANAGIQGSFRIVTALKYPKVRAIVAGIAGSAYAYNHLNEAVNAEGYNRLSDTEKDTNLIFMLPPDFSPTEGERKILGGNDKDGYYIKLKLPYGYNIFKVLGDSAYNMTSGKKTVAEEMKHLLLAMDASFNPLSSGSLLQFGSPTITDPIVQQMENKNWFGAPIKPDQPAYDQPVRESSLYFKGATEQSKAVTEWLNRVTGGNEVKAGFIDISPEIVDHYVDFIAGGVGSLFNATFDAGATLVKGDLPDIEEMPFVRKFIDKPFEQAEKFQMYDLLDESSTNILPKVKRDRFIESVKTALETEQVDDKTAKKVIKDFMVNEGRVKAGEIYTLYMEGNKEEALKLVENADQFTEAEFKKLLKKKLEDKLKERAKATQN